MSENWDENSIMKQSIERKKMWMQLTTKIQFQHFKMIVWGKTETNANQFWFWWMLVFTKWFPLEMVKFFSLLKIDDITMKAIEL